MGISKNKKKFILALIVLDIIYVFFEIALNASILELASGLVISKDKIETIEHFGRTLSGVGLALTIFSLVNLPKGLLKKCLSFGFICALSIPFMHVIQNFIVDDIIVSKSSPEKRGDAELVVTYRDGMTLGVLGLGSEIPFDLENPTSPEELAMTSIFALSIFNDYSSGLLRKDYDFFSDIKVAELTDFARKIYPHYVSLSSDLKIAMDTNNEMVTNNGASPAAIKAGSMAFDELRSLAEQKLVEIHDIESKAYDHVLTTVKKWNPNKILGHCLRNDWYSCGAITKMLRRATGADKGRYEATREFLKPRLCYGGCPKTDEQWANKIIKDSIAIDEFQRRYGFTPGAFKTTAELMTSREFFSQTSFELAQKLSGNKSTSIKCRTSNYGRSIGDIKSCLINFAQKEGDFSSYSDLKLPDFLDGKKRYSERTLLNHPEVVSELKRLMRHYYVPLSSLSLTESQFVREISGDRNRQFIVANIKKLAQSNQVDFKKGGSREIEGEAYIKALYVPPIALFFSLFFTFATLARITSRVVMVMFYDNKRVKYISTITTVLLLSSIVVIPTYLMDNKFNTDTSIYRLEKIRGQYFTPKQKLVVKWGLTAQPIIYRIGEPIIRKFGVERDR